MKKGKIGASLLLFILLLSTVIPVYADEKVKKLYFEQQNGTMVWNADKGSNGNWFMSFTNMVPGESYQDSLVIENGSSKTYELYFQIVPLEQAELKDELLEKIQMTIMQDGKQIYKGNATGEPGTKDLQNIVPLGTYTPAKESTLVVELTLDGDIGLEYCDLLTQIDWKFMVKEKVDSKKDTPVTEIKPPKTGDTTNTGLWIFVVIGSMTVMGVVNVFRHRKETAEKQLEK